MYNRYIPGDTSYIRLEQAAPLPRRAASGGGSAMPRWQVPLRITELFTGRESLSSLMKILEKIDSGDILLLLVALYLWKEGEEPDMAIALGLVLLMELWEGEK